MPRKKKNPRNNLGIPEYEMKSLARMLLPIFRSISHQMKENKTGRNGKPIYTMHRVPPIRKLQKERNLTIKAKGYLKRTKPQTVFLFAALL